MKRINVYFASKMHHAEVLRDFAKAFPQINVVSSWIYHPVEWEREHGAEEFRRHWAVDDVEVKMSDCVVICGMQDDKPLQGALVEVGMAIAHGKPVYLLGDYPFGTWRHHPLVRKCEDLFDVISDWK